ncbi:hypothetical protein HDV05_008162, partial [Chytridiales sp. JEL 0842]
YRIKDDLVYEISISEYFNNAWHPYQATDVQFEAVMLDPYIRTPLLPAGVNPTHPHSGTLRTTIKLPDVYGVFTFKVEYLRPGLSWIEQKETVAIHPFRHNEYPRFLSSAYPYYVNSFSMIASFWVLTAVVLYYRAPAPKVKTQ